MSENQKVEIWQPELPGFEETFYPRKAMVKATDAKIQSLGLSQAELEAHAAEIQMLYSLAHELDVAFAAPRMTIAHTNMMTHFRELLATLPVKEVAAEADPYDRFLEELMNDANAQTEVRNPA
ncbi:hypothetical protein [uncultured Mobiluncus sp.]|uniref:hypothetical protein n=1 Tax=uncultured Mobiluncus sp. TaxID=293425 RepID=UPI0026340279|nr:hypothetical protein [uncultured Mobiluncus sp.]